MRQTISSCALLCGLAACSPTSETETEAPSAFQFETQEELRLGVRVTNNGEPVRGASVTITEAYGQVAETEDSATEAVGETLFRGGTRADGMCTGAVVIPTRFPVVDVVVHVPGMRGPYTSEQLRAKWGPFAPSARVTLAVEELRSVTIEMEDL